MTEGIRKWLDDGGRVDEWIIPSAEAKEEMEKKKKQQEKDYTETEIPGAGAHVGKGAGGKDTSGSTKKADTNPGTGFGQGVTKATQTTASSAGKGPGYVQTIVYPKMVELTAKAKSLPPDFGTSVKVVQTNVTGTLVGGSGANGTVLPSSGNATTSVTGAVVPK